MYFPHPSILVTECIPSSVHSHIICQTVSLTSLRSTVGATEGTTLSLLRTVASPTAAVNTASGDGSNTSSDDNHPSSSLDPKFERFAAYLGAGWTSRETRTDPRNKWVGPVDEGRRVEVSVE